MGVVPLVTSDEPFTVEEARDLVRDLLDGAREDAALPPEAVGYVALVYGILTKTRCTCSQSSSRPAASVSPLREKRPVDD